MPVHMSQLLRIPDFDLMCDPEHNRLLAAVYPAGTAELNIDIRQQPIWECEGANGPDPARIEINRAGLHGCVDRSL